jgi:hypothetical protein
VFSENDVVITLTATPVKSTQEMWKYVFKIGYKAFESFNIGWISRKINR